MDGKERERMRRWGLCRKRGSESDFYSMYRMCLTRR